MQATINEAQNEAVIRLDWDDLQNNPAHRIAALIVPTLAQLLSDAGADHPGGNPRFVSRPGSDVGQAKMILRLSTRVE